MNEKSWMNSNKFKLYDWKINIERNEMRNASETVENETKL